MPGPESVESFSAADFHGGLLPQSGQGHIEVTGLDVEGLVFVEEEILYALAGAVDLRSRSRTLELTLPNALRGWHQNRRYEVLPREGGNQHLLSTASVTNGSANIARTNSSLDVVWAADLLLTGYSKVATSKLDTSYRVHSGRAIREINSIQIDTNEQFRRVTQRSRRTRQVITPLD